MLQDSLLAPRPPWVADALGLLARYRFLTARQFAAVIGRGEGDVASALEGLVAEGVLQTLTPTTIALAAPKGSAFALTRAGLACIATEHVVNPHQIVRPLRSSFTLAHELLVNEFALVLHQLDARRTLRLLSWETRRERIADVAHLAVKGRALRIPLVADGLAVVEHGGRKQGLLIEVDLGTVSARRMREKFAGYHAWWAEGGPVRRWGLGALRVLTIAPAPRRLERLRDLALEAVDGRGSGLFWFLPQMAVDVTHPEHLLETIAFVGKAGEDERCTLFSS